MQKNVLFKEDIAQDFRSVVCLLNCGYETSIECFCEKCLEVSLRIEASFE